MHGLHDYVHALLHAVHRKMTVPLFSLWTDKWEVKQGRFILSEMKEIRTFSAPVCSTSCSKTK